jgi:hypothetical protein
MLDVVRQADDENAQNPLPSTAGLVDPPAEERLYKNTRNKRRSS